MKTGWTFTFLAFAVAFLLHLAAFYLVDSSSEEAGESEIETSPRAFMVDPEQSSYDWEQELDYFFRLQRPDLMAIPNYSIGFCSSVMENSEQYYSPSPAHSVTIITTPMPESAGIEMAKQVFDFRQLMEQVDLMPDIEIGKDEKTEMPEMPAKIIWRLDSGEILEAFPTTIPANLYENIIEEPPDWYTEIEVLKESGKSVRVRLRNSSGNSMLDQFALKLLGRKIALAETKAKNKLSDSTKKLWPQDSESVILEVEWRPAVSKIKLNRDEETQDSTDK